MPTLLKQFLSDKFRSVLEGERVEVEIDPNDTELMTDLEFLDIMTAYLTKHQGGLSMQEVDGRVYIYMTPASVKEPVHL